MTDDEMTRIAALSIRAMLGVPLTPVEVGELIAAGVLREVKPAESFAFVRRSRRIPWRAFRRAPACMCSGCQSRRIAIGQSPIPKGKLQ